MVNIDIIDFFKKEYSKFFMYLNKDNNGNYQNKITTFVMQSGKKYNHSKTKCLFIGKSVNRWVSFSKDVEELFDLNNPERIINMDDEMEWVKEYNGSAFWRVIKGISKKLFQELDWYNYISWSNIYKFSPYDGGNPDNYLKYLQKNICFKILDKEIEYLKPDFIIFLSSGWESFYLDHINLDRAKNKEITWERFYKNYRKKYKIYFQKYNGIVYIQSVHPERKPEYEHINKIVEIIKNMGHFA